MRCDERPPAGGRGWVLAAMIEELDEDDAEDDVDDVCVVQPGGGTGREAATGPARSDDVTLGRGRDAGGA